MSLAPEDSARADYYAILARLFQAPPDAAFLAALAAAGARAQTRPKKICLGHGTRSPSQPRQPRLTASGANTRSCSWPSAGPRWCSMPHGI